jgi:hypothetical protein
MATLGLKTKTWKDLGQGLAVGSAVVLGTGWLTGMLNTVLGFIPSTPLGGVAAPHGYLAAGLLAYATTWLYTKWMG